MEKLDLSNRSLEGKLDLDSFHSLKEVNISGNPKLGKIMNRHDEEDGERFAVVKAKAQDWLN